MNALILRVPDSVRRHIKEVAQKEGVFNSVVNLSQLKPNRQILDNFFEADVG